MFRFTIRDVLWLTAVVALAAGLWIDRSRLASDAREMARLRSINAILTDALTETIRERDQLVETDEVDPPTFVSPIERGPKDAPRN